MFGLEWITSPEAWLALLTLTALEIVLGIDNIIFISILVSRLPEHQRQRARMQGLGLAMITRIALLLSLAWVMRLTTPIFTILEQAISGRDLILLGGGLFLLYKSSQEMWENLEGEEEEHTQSKPVTSYAALMGQIAIVDIIFSLDSVITAVGMAKHVPVMVLAIVIAVGVMMFAAKAIGDFVDNHPSIKMLALSFLVLVGVTLIAAFVFFWIHFFQSPVPAPMSSTVFVSSLFHALNEKTNCVRRKISGLTLKD